MSQCRDMELKLIFIKNVLSVGHGETQCAYTSVWSTKKQALKINPHICRPKTTTQAKAGWWEGDMQEGLCCSASVTKCFEEREEEDDGRPFTEEIRFTQKDKNTLFSFFFFFFLNSSEFLKPEPETAFNLFRNHDFTESQKIDLVPHEKIFEWHETGCEVSSQKNY